MRLPTVSPISGNERPSTRRSAWRQHFGRHSSGGAGDDAGRLLLSRPTNPSPHAATRSGWRTSLHKPQEVVIVRLESGRAAGEFLNWVVTREGESPGELIAGVTGLADRPEPRPRREGRRERVTAGDEASPMVYIRPHVPVAIVHLVTALSDGTVTIPEDDAGPSVIRSIGA